MSKKSSTFARKIVQERKIPMPCPLIYNGANDEMVSALRANGEISV